MVNRYMQQERTITLAVVPAHVYMHDTEILQAAQKADPSGTGTIAVITKLNLVDTGAELGVHELLLKKKSAWSLAIMPSQLELTNGTTIEKNVVNEMGSTRIGVAYRNICGACQDWSNGWCPSCRTISVGRCRR